jgi:hypothetical protein
MNGFAFKMHINRVPVKFLAVIMFFLMLFSALSAGEEKSNNYFTDQDLQQYRKPSLSEDQRDTTQPAETGAPASLRDSFRKTKKYEVPYVAYEGLAGRVIVDVTFNGSVTAPMALDTGSPSLVISNELAERLGLLDEGSNRIETFARGIGGAVPAILTIVDTVNIGGAEDHFVPTTVTPSISTAFEGLIGMDFMSKYSMQIDTVRHILVFQEVEATASMPAGHSERWWRTNFRLFASVRSQWKDFHETVKRRYNDLDGGSHSVSESEILKNMQSFADGQVRAADNLFHKLHNYAAEHAVPMHWRQY